MHYCSAFAIAQILQNYFVLISAVKEFYLRENVCIYQNKNTWFWQFFENFPRLYGKLR